jgi:hypothetical protein
MSALRKPMWSLLRVIVPQEGGAWLLLLSSSSGSVVNHCIGRPVTTSLMANAQMPLSQVLRSLLKGVPTLGRAQSLAILDVSPYDGTLPMMLASGLDAEDADLPGVPGVPGVPAAVRRPPAAMAKPKAAACISMLWAGGEASMEDNTKTKIFVAERVREKLLVDMRAGRSTLPGAEHIPPGRSIESFMAGPKAVLDDQHFHYTKPLADGSLPILQSLYDKFSLYEHAVYAQFEALAATHNALVNESGRAFKDGKRARDEEGEDPADAGEALPLKPAADDPESKAALLELFPNDVVVLPGPNASFELAVVRDGRPIKV